MLWCKNIERSHVLPKKFLVFFCQSFDTYALFSASTNSLIVNVGNVHSLLYHVALIFKNAPNNIVHDKCPKIADMSAIVDGRPTVIHANGCVGFCRFC